MIEGPQRPAQHLVYKLAWRRACICLLRSFEGNWRTEQQSNLPAGGSAGVPKLSLSQAECCPSGCCCVRVCCLWFLLREAKTYLQQLPHMQTYLQMHLYTKYIQCRCLYIQIYIYIYIYIYCDIVPSGGTGIPVCDNSPLCFSTLSRRAFETGGDVPCARGQHRLFGHFDSYHLVAQP